MQSMATGIHEQGGLHDQFRRNEEEQERYEREMELVQEREYELVQAAERGDVAEVVRLTNKLHVNPDCERVCSRSIRYAIDFKILIYLQHLHGRLDISEYKAFRFACLSLMGNTTCPYPLVL